jgi:DNA-binding NarL/FixJ family response regulator
MMPPINIILFEDNLLLQKSLCDVLQLNNINVLATFDNASGMAEAYETFNPDVILTDIDMPEVSGLQGLADLKKKYPEAKLLILTVFDDNDKVLNAICLGANGYILKSTSPARIADAINDVAQGGSPLTPSVAGKILKHFPKTQPSPAAADLLSAKEKEVLELLVKGYSYKMIAAALEKSLETVRVQIKSIYKKLQVQSNAEAIIKALGH